MADLVLVRHRQQIGLVVQVEIARRARSRPSRRAPRAVRRASVPCAACATPPRSRRSAPARSRNRACAEAGPSSRSTRPARRRGCRRQVRTSSIFSRSSDCTLSAKSSIVLRSLRSRDCAIIDMVRCSSISQATSSVCLALRPRRGQSLRATFAPGDRVVLRPALGDVVQQHGDVEHLAILDLGHQPRGERMIVVLRALLDARQHIDRAQQVLVDRIVVVHVELHHRDDLAEIGNEAAEHAGLVHAPQDQRRAAPATSGSTGTAGSLPRSRAGRH